MTEKLFMGLFIGFVVGLGVSGLLTVKLEKDTWNKAINTTASVVLNEPNRFGGFDQTYDLGYQHCQEASFNFIKELKRE